jgi:hypothetical protein
VGTQNRSGTIKHALLVETAYRILPPSHPGEQIQERQGGIFVESGLTRQPRRTQTSIGVQESDTAEELEHVSENSSEQAEHSPEQPQQGEPIMMSEIPSQEEPGSKPEWTSEALPRITLDVPLCMGFDVRGDERLEGPVYNYARAFTWCQFSFQLHDAFSAVVGNLEAGKAVGGQQRHQDWDPAVDLQGNTIETAQYCNLPMDPSHQILAYPRKIDSVYKSGRIQKRMWYAFTVAMVVQWGTTGSAIVMAYLTPTVGLGCRSGGYLLYGSIGTGVLVFLLSSMLLSQAAMRMYQEKYSNIAADQSIDVDASSRTTSHTIICVLAVSTRVLGKTLAVANTVWLVLSSLFEYIGLYNNCWCKSSILSLHDKAWVVLFKTDTDFRTVAQGPWIGGIIMGTVICLSLWLFFRAGTVRI